MNPTEVQQLLEKCKAATPEAEQWNTESPASKEWKANKINNAAFIRSANPQTIQTLAENYLAAIDILKEVAEITSDVDEQGYQYDWMQHVDSFTFQPVRLFLKKVGIDASEGKGRE